MNARNAVDLTVGPIQLRARPPRGLGLVLLGPAGGDDTPTAYLDEVFADTTAREAFFQLVDTHGLVVARNLLIDPAPYRFVRGKRMARRLSQGEFFHHDGCSTPIKPRVVEIRCPDQIVLRAMGTTIAPFPQVVQTMLRVLPDHLRDGGGLQDYHRALMDNELDGIDWHHVQGMVNRIIRQIDAEAARAYFQEVDEQAECFNEPWTFHESRFMANTNSGQTVQHRRACLLPWVRGTPNGHLLKRWPAEEMVTPFDPDVCIPCSAPG